LEYPRTDPTPACLTIRKLRGSDRNTGFVSDPGKRLKRPENVLPLQLHHQVHVQSHSAVAMRNHRKPPDKKIPHLLLFKGANDLGESGKFHGFAASQSQPRQWAKYLTMRQGRQRETHAFGRICDSVQRPFVVPALAGMPPEGGTTNACVAGDAPNRRCAPCVSHGGTLGHASVRWPARSVARASDRAWRSFYARPARGAHGPPCGQRSADSLGNYRIFTRW
jgi:hypothetical protein